MSKFNVSSSPHVKSPVTTQGIMLDVIISLIPAAFAGTAVFGARAALVIAVCIASCVLFEFLSRKIMKRHSTIGDLSAVVTGLLLAFNLPVNLPIWMCVVGSFVAIVIVKQFFGGIGRNFANPAITARIVLLVSFASAMSSFPVPGSKAVDAVTGPTPLYGLGSLDMTADIGVQLKKMLASGDLPSLFDMFFGIRGGCIGETCSLALILGGIYLICRRVISPAIPLAYIGTVGVFMLAVSRFNLTYTAYELMSGGLLLGAFFMATDYTTSPITKKGKVIFGIGCGVLTCVIRLYGSLPEGVSYSILLMNIVCPLIEMATKPKFFGFVKQKKEKKEA